jgi:hypothetical protein
MSKYSFLLQSEEPEFFELTPKVRLRKHGGWLVAEGIEQEELSKAQSQATIRAVQLAKRIATAKDIPLDEAFALLQGGADMSEMELLSDFTEETLGMINSGGSVETGNARMVTVFIRCRGYYPINLTIDKQAFKKQLTALGNIKPVIKIDDSQLDAARARISTLNKSLATLRRATSRQSRNRCRQWY